MVLDASAAYELCTAPTGGRWRPLEHTSAGHRRPWIAPDVVLFEVLSAIRRRTLTKFLTAGDGHRALRRLQGLPIKLVPTAELLDEAWELRDRFAAADALYAVLALRMDRRLVTFDAPFARAAHAAGIEIDPATDPR
jgi:predicted nucleic acid-binding protein